MTPQNTPPRGTRPPDAFSDEPVHTAQAFLNALPYAHALGMRIESIGDGKATISMPYDARLIGDPDSGVIHGGAVSALMDTSGAAAVMSLPGVTSAATLDLRIDYMRPATPGQRITARAECYHATRSAMFVRAIATDEDLTRPVANATGVFTAERGADRAAARGSGGGPDSGATQT